jgi:hypothetical protein
MKLPALIIAAAVVSVVAISSSAGDGSITGTASRATATATVAPSTAPTLPKYTPTPTPAQTYPGVDAALTSDAVFLGRVRAKESFESEYVYSDSELLNLADTICSAFDPTSLRSAQAMLVEMIEILESAGVDDSDAAGFVGMAVGHSCPAKGHWITDLTR